MDVETSQLEETMMVVALAGRRIDAKNAAEPRFPPSMVSAVGERLRSFFLASQVTTLVTSAANGTDLVALDVAGQLGIRRIVILAEGREAFRKASVDDREGDWGSLYDRILDEVAAKSDLLIVDGVLGEEAYARVNERVLDEAAGVAEQEDAALQAVIVWNGRSRGPDDVTATFAAMARMRGFPVREIASL